MQKKWVWGLVTIGVTAIIAMAVYNVQNYNEQLQAGSDQTANPEAIQQDNSSVATVESNEAAVYQEVVSDDSKESEEPEKKLAPDFTLKDLEGNDVSINNFRGKKVFLTFWATWCPYCKKQMPILQELEDGGKRRFSYTCCSYSGFIKN
jgi:thioredoxin-like negative regulator of GroEL